MLYIESVLKPHLTKESVLILDNASFHKPSTLSKFAKKIGCTVKFLPPYSPDFNKIENHWYSVKTKLRKILRDQVGIDMNSAINEIFMCAE